MKPEVQLFDGKSGYITWQTSTTTTDVGDPKDDASAGAVFAPLMRICTDDHEHFSRRTYIQFRKKMN